MRRATIVGFAGIGVSCLFLAGGCGFGDKQISDAEKRVEALAAKGAPDSLLSKARVFIYNARTANQLQKTGEAKRNGDSLLLMLAQAESQYQASANDAKPFVDSLVASIIERKKGLTGLQLRAADSMMVFVDSLVKTSAYRQAKDKALEMDTMMIQLVADEAKAKETLPKVLGTWGSVETSKFGCVQTRKFVFKPDMTTTVEEARKGQVDEYRKDDWKFVSSGTFDMKGDTVFLFITKEKCERQTYWNLKDGKWEKKDAPTFDTTYTRHEKDQYLTYEYMTTSLDKAKR